MEIPISQQIQDQYEVDPLGQVLINTITTETGTRLRDGTSLLYDLGESVEVLGLHDWYAQNSTIAVSNGKIFKLNDSILDSGVSYLLLETGDKLLFEVQSGSLLLDSAPVSANVTDDTLGVVNPVIFADYGDYLYMANGGQILELHPSASTVSYDDGGGSRNYTCLTNNINSAPAAGGTADWQDDGLGNSHSAWDATVRYGSGLAQVLEDSSWPTTVSWIATVDGYLFAIDDGTQNIYQSEVEKPWSNAGDIFQAEQLPDHANAMRVYGGDLWISGHRSIQTFTNDGSTATFVPSSYGAITTGTIAPYSFLEIDGKFMFIDNERRFVALNGREPQVISKSLNTFIRDVSTISDAIAHEVVLEGETYYVCNFPSDQTSFAINVNTGKWSEWSYVSSGQSYKWEVSCSAYIPRWDILVGGCTDGKLKTISSRYADDGGTSISAKIRSPRIHTGVRTRVSELVISLTQTARLVTTPTTSFTVRWRDDGGDWNTARTITLDNSQTDHVVHIRRLGSYRHDRQYEFDVSSLWPYSIVRIEQI